MEAHQKQRAAALAALTVAAAVLLAAPASATFPGRHGLIAFAADAGSGSQIYTVKPNGKQLRQVTRLDGDAVNPDWSPDGRTIAFELATAAGVTVDLMRPDGTGLRTLTPPTACCSGDPSFTPDGKRLVFARFDPASNDEAVWRMNLDGSGQVRVVGLPTGSIDPNVSPSGRTLTFRSSDGLPGDNGALFRSASDGSGVTRVTPFAFVSIKHDWAPNGRRIVYSDGADTGDPNVSTNIATIAPDGTHLRHLTNYQGGAVSAFAGSYSPDGRSIVLRLEDHGSFALYTMRTDGSHLKLMIALGSLKPRVSDWGPRATRGGHH
jgi:Tol biopolymer transport system component